jgi:hypothetical protein
MRAKRRGFNWQSTYRRTSSSHSAAGAHVDAQQATQTRQHTDGINDLDNPLGGSYHHPQHGSRPRVSDQQLFNYIIIMLTALLQLLHPTSPSRDRRTDRQRSDHVAAPLFLNGLSVGLTERSLSPTYDTHVALGLGTPTHPLAANCRSYLQHEGIPIFPYTKTEHTTHATRHHTHMRTRALTRAHAHAVGRHVVL